MIIGKAYFHDTIGGQYHRVYELNGLALTKLDEDSYYIVGKYVYPYLGEFTSSAQMKRSRSGGLGLVRGKLFFQPWETEEELEAHSVKNIVGRDLSKEMITITADPDKLFQEYTEAWKSGRNLTTKIKRSVTDDDVYIPTIRDNDCPLELVLKKMIIALKIVSSEERKKVDSDYHYDNMVSSLDGATKHLSILKFLEWAKLLELTWEFSVFDIADDVEYPLGEIIKVTEADSGWIDIEVPDRKDVYVVPLKEGEDPYKRIIKLALYKKMVPTATYRKKGSTNHQINNMKSALRSDQKMTSDYFTIWCELLNMGYTIKLTSKTGIWYQAVGYEITTNYKEEGTMPYDE